MKRILVRSKKHGNKFALIDDEDYQLVSQYRWNLKKIHKDDGFYACVDVSPTRTNRKSIVMHRLIMNAKSGQIVDHKNHLTLDNRKINLRIASHSESCRNRKLFTNNTTGFKGVLRYYKKTRDFRYLARIGHLKEKIIIGYFKNRIDAAKAYNEAALKYHGEFAKLNILNHG